MVGEELKRDTVGVIEVDEAVPGKGPLVDMKRRGVKRDPVLGKDGHRLFEVGNFEADVGGAYVTVGELEALTAWVAILKDLQVSRPDGDEPEAELGVGHAHRPAQLLTFALDAELAEK